MWMLEMVIWRINLFSVTFQVCSAVLLLLFNTCCYVSIISQSIAYLLFSDSVIVVGVCEFQITRGIE